MRTGGWEVLDKMVQNRKKKKIYIYIYIFGVPENRCETGKKKLKKISFL